jgi:hypothetical protein
MATTYISLRAEAELALLAAEQRLLKARADVAHFLSEKHAGNDALGHLLTIEVDEAERLFKKCQMDLADIFGV